MKLILRKETDWITPSTPNQMIFRTKGGKEEVDSQYTLGTQYLESNLRLHFPKSVAHMIAKEADLVLELLDEIKLDLSHLFPPSHVDAFCLIVQQCLSQIEPQNIAFIRREVDDQRKEVKKNNAFADKIRTDPVILLQPITVYLDEGQCHIIEEGLDRFCRNTPLIGHSGPFTLLTQFMDRYTMEPMASKYSREYSRLIIRLTGEIQGLFNQIANAFAETLPLDVVHALHKAACDISIEPFYFPALKLYMRMMIKDFLKGGVVSALVMANPIEIARSSVLDRVCGIHAYPHLRKEVENACLALALIRKSNKKGDTHWENPIKNQVAFLERYPPSRLRSVFSEAQAAKVYASVVQIQLSINGLAAKLKKCNCKTEFIASVHHGLCNLDATPDQIQPLRSCIDQFIERLKDGKYMLKALRDPTIMIDGESCLDDLRNEKLSRSLKADLDKFSCFISFDWASMIVELIIASSVILLKLNMCWTIVLFYSIFFLLRTVEFDDRFLTRAFKPFLSKTNTLIEKRASYLVGSRELIFNPK